MRKKFKYLRQILIPCLSLVGVASVAIPMSIMCTKKHYVKIDANETSFSMSSMSHEYKVYLYKNLDNGQKIIVQTNIAPHSGSQCWMEPTSEPIVSDKTIKIQTTIRSTQGEVKVNDIALFDMHLTCIDEESNTIVWQDTIKTLRVEKR